MKVLTEDGAIPDKDRPSRKGSTFGSNKQLHKMVIVPGMQVLLFNSRLRLFPGKLIPNWSGPFKVSKLFPDGKVEIEDKVGCESDVSRIMREHPHFKRTREPQKSHVILH